MTNTTRDDLLTDLEKWEASHARWEAEAASSEAEINGIRARMGEAVLADEDQAGILSTKVRDLHDRVDVAKRAAAAAAPKVRQARSAVLMFDADIADRNVAERQKMLTSHTTKTAKLLKQLEDHEGRFVPDGASLTKSRELEWDVARAQLLSDVLRDVAAGEDPMHRFTDGTALGMPLAEFLPPALWGPSAVAPLPTYLHRVDSARSRLDRLDAETAAYVDVEPEIAKLEEKIESLNKTIKARLLSPQPTDEESEFLSGWRWKISQLRSKDEREAALRAETQAELDALTTERAQDA